MSRPSKFGSNKLTNRDQSCGPMLEGSVSVATNFMFSASGLRGHHPDVMPAFSVGKINYSLMSSADSGSADSGNTDSGNTDSGYTGQ